MPYRTPLFILPLFILPAVILFTPCFAGGPDGPYMLEAWTVEEGLPQNSVLCVLQDKTGYIWFGTQSGLVRFDGVAFRIYDRWNTPGMKNDKITALYEDERGTLWVGTGTGGLCRKINEDWTTYTTGEGLSNNDIRAIYGERNGNLWIGTANGINRFDTGNEKIEVYTDGENPWGNTVTAMCALPGGGLWVGSYGSGLYTLKDGRYEPVAPGGKPLENEITSLYQDRVGRLWIGTEDGLLWLENGRIRTPAPEGHPLSDNAVRSLMEDSGGSVWIGTDGEGVYRFTRGRFIAVSLRRDHSLNDDFIYAFMQDREGNLWIGTHVSGLVRLTPARVTAITPENGLPQNLVSTLVEDEEGVLWVGGRKGISKIGNNNTIETILPGSRVTAIYRDRDRMTWVGTQKNGIIRLGDGNTRRYTTKNGLSSDEITVITADRSGTVWIGTSGGLNRLKNGRVSISGESLYINTLVEDYRDILWIGTRQGLFQLNGDRPGWFLTAAGGKITYDILSLYPDKNGRLWAGTNGSGLIRINGGTFTHYTTDTGLPGNYIFGILEDNRGNLWMSSYRGVFRVSISQLEAVAAADRGEISPLTPLCLDEKDGMGSSECVAGGQPSACRTAGGLLCFPTVKGVAVIDPSAMAVNRVPPGVLIEKVIVDNRPVNPGGEVVFSPGITVMEFYFTALSFTDPGKVKLRYKLEGNDDRWLETAPRGKRMAFYLNLVPGKYRFDVIACNNDGLWNDKGAVFRFEINTPFYKRPLFYGFILLVVLVAAAVISRQFSREKGRKTIPGSDGGEGEQKYKTSALLPETVDEVLPRLMAMIEKEKVFLKADLTMKALAERLNVHYNHLSRIVNERYKQNFNDFINKYRIEEARKKLTDPSESKKTILEIAYDTGFYSKSVFNTAFKKFTGMTPSEYRKGKGSA